MRLRPIPFATKSAKAGSGVVSSERLVNCFLEINPEGSKSPASIYGDAGLNLFATLPGAPIRGMHLFDENTLFVAAGANVYTLTRDALITNVGALPGGGRVRMCSNATHVAIATNLGLYAATKSSIVFVDSNNYSSATYQDGYGIFTLRDTEQFYISNVDDMTVVNPLNFSSADTFPDKAVGCLSDHRELIVFGEESIEHYGNSGNAYFPFTRTPGGFVEIGCEAAGSIAKKSNNVFWLGRDGAVWAMVGYAPRRISTPGIERRIKDAPTRVDAEAFCYSIEGHDCYVISFGTFTLVYDMSTGLWRERESFGLDRWRVDGHVSIFGKELVSDYSTGDIYELDLETYDENGEILLRTVQLQPVHNSGSRAVMHELFVDAEMGVEQVIGSSDSPAFVLTWSDDGGATWANVRHGVLMKTGERYVQARWTRLGSFTQRTIRITYSSASKMAVTGAFARLEGGDK